MRNIALLLCYKGSAYHGWQSQKNADSVQSTLEKAVCRVCTLSSPIYGCGRTDAGVHALGYVCNFSSETKIPDEKIPFALNCVLPDDIRVLSAKTVCENFHARYSTKKKTYIYKILNSPHSDVFLKDLVWHYRPKLDIEKMRAASRFFVGEHDFYGFCASGAQSKNFVREIYSIDISTEGNVIEIKISGNGFLYNMVRIIAGTLVYVGEGRICAEEIKKIIDSRDRNLAGITAPPQGLYMAQVEYEEKIFDT